MLTLFSVVVSARVLTFATLRSQVSSGSRSYRPPLFSLQVKPLTPTMFPNIMFSTGDDKTSATTLPLKNGVSIWA